MRMGQQGNNLFVTFLFIMGFIKTKRERGEEGSLILSLKGTL